MNQPARIALLIVWTAWAVLVLALCLHIGWRIKPEWFLPAAFHADQLGEPLRALAGFLLLLPAILGWGCIAGRAFSLLPEESRAARALVILLLGQLAASLLVLVIGLAGLYPLGVWLVLFGAGGMVWEAPRWRLRDARPFLPAGPARWWSLACIIVCTAAFIPGLAPVVESDGLRYHLFAPQEWLKAGGIAHLPHHAFSNLPLQHNMLYLAGLVFGNGSTAHLIHWLSIPTIMLATYCLAANSELGTRNSELSVIASLLVGTMPVVLVLSGWPFIDLATLAYLLGALWAATSTALSQERRRLLLAGLLCGAAIGTKLTALIPAFFLGIGLVPVFLRIGHGRTRTNTDGRGQLSPRSQIPTPNSQIHPLSFILHPLLFLLPLLLVPSPWLIKSALLHGNPVYPAAYNTFGGPEWSAEIDAFYNDRASQRGFGRTIGDFAASPFDITLRWSRMPGDVPSDFIRREARERGWPSRLFMHNSPGFEEQNPGPAPLVLLPLALAAILLTLLSPPWDRRAPHRREWPITFILALQLLGGWAAWFLTYQATRFALLPLAISIILAMPLLARLAHDNAIARWIVRALLFACAALGFGWFVIYSLFVNPTFFAATGFIDRERIIEHRFNAWPAVRYLNAESNGHGVFYIGEHRGFHAQYPVHLSDWFDTPLILAEIRATPDNAALLQRWQDAKIRHVLLNQAELSLYEDALFRPRFTAEEWQRFAALRQQLLASPNAIAFRDPERPIYVIDLSRLP